MAVNAEHRFYYHHLPKTGGMALRAALAEAFPGTRLKGGHWRLGQSAALLGVRSDYYIMAVVRNPYERFVSAWMFLQSGGMNPTDVQQSRRWVRSYTFRQFCETLRRQPSPVHHQVHFRTMSSYLPVHCPLPVHVFRTPDEAMRGLWAHLGRTDPVPPVPRLNESGGGAGGASSRTTRYTGSPLRPAILDQAAADAIYEAYRDDFERFGFERDSWKTLRRNVTVVLPAPPSPLPVSASTPPTMTPPRTTSEPSATGRGSRRHSPHARRLDRALTLTETADGGETTPFVQGNMVVAVSAGSATAISSNVSSTAAWVARRAGKSLKSALRKRR